MKLIIILLVLFNGFNCLVRESLLIQTQKNDLNQFDITMKQDNFLIIGDNEESIYQKLNFLRQSLWMDDYYEEVMFEIDDILYKRLYACVKIEGYYLREKFAIDLNLIFDKYRDKIKSLRNISIKHRMLYASSGIMGITTSHCLILTGTLNDGTESERRENGYEKTTN